MTKLRCENLSYNAGQKPLIASITHAFSAGSLTALIGPNGAGKTTWLKMLAGLLPPSGGTIYANDRDLATFSMEETAQTISWLSSREVPAFAFTVRDVVTMGRFPHHQGMPQPDDRKRCEECLNQMGITSLADRFVTTLSDGELQKVRIARTLAQDTPVVICDEPLTALDPEAALTCLRALRRKADQGCLVCVSVHDLNMALQCFDQVVCLSAGHIQAAGRPDQVITPQNLADVFQTSAKIERTESGKHALTY